MNVLRISRLLISICASGDVLKPQDTFVYQRRFFAQSALAACEQKENKATIDIVAAKLRMRNSLLLEAMISDRWNQLSSLGLSVGWGIRGASQMTCLVGRNPR